MEKLLLGAVLAGAFALRAVNLEHNGWGAEYYSAAVRSMAASWHNFLFCAFDPAGYISVDKPPVALWIQVVSAKIFGYQPASLLLPQALEGVGCVALAYFLVRRRFGVAAAMLAAGFLAITPILVAVNRTNNTDSALLLVLLLAAAALLEAAERGSRRWLLAAMALVGVAFNTKMLAGFIVLPTFFLVYWIAAPHGWRRRLLDLSLGSLLLAAVSLAWVAIVDLTPPERRPYVGSSATNSALELTIGHNALSRFVRRAAPAPTRANAPSTATAADDSIQATPGVIQQRLFVRAAPGAWRFLDGQIAAQVGWLAPFALLGAWLGFAGGLRRTRDPPRVFVLFWLCWLATYAIVYSFAGGIIHFYYFVTLAPPLAALAAIGIVESWKLHREPGWRSFLLPAAILATALWQTYVQLAALGWRFDVMGRQPDDWRAWLHAAMLIGAVIAAGGLIFLRNRRLLARAESLGTIALGLASLVILPLAWTASAIAAPANGILPSADLYRLDPAVLDSEDPRVTGRFGQMADVRGLVELLEANRSGERFLLATTTTRFAAPIIILTGEPVMAMGGYHGLDAAMTPDRLAALAREGQVRYVMLNDAAAPSRRLGSEAALEPLAGWVRANGRRVPRTQWPSSTIPRDVAIFDLRPLSR